MKKLIVCLSVFSLTLPFLPGVVLAEEQPPEGAFAPGQIEGTGTLFEITDSAYLNIRLTSQTEITVRMESYPRIVSIMFFRSGDAGNASITIAGLEPSTTYYMYEDDLENVTAFTTDTSGKYAFEQDTSVEHLVFIQPEKSTKLIRDDATGGDCTSIGTWDNLSKTCTLSVDMGETVQISGSNITLDGNGRALTGTGTGNGVYVTRDSHNVKIINLTTNNFSNGIYVLSSNNVVITGTIATNNYNGFYLSGVNGSDVSNCVLQENYYALRTSIHTNGFVRDNRFNLNYAGIWASTSSEKYNEYTGNIFTNNQHGIFFAGWSPGSVGNNYFADNVFENNSDHGLKFHTNEGNVIENNYFKGSLWGTFTTQGNTYFHNTLEENDYGIGFGGSDGPIEVYQNNFINNVTGDIYCALCPGYEFDRELPIGGNYWSRYDSPEEGCVDLIPDGFCDDAYDQGGYRDRYPWIRPSGWLGNGAPNLDPIGDQTVLEGQLLQFTVTATDPDGDNLTYAASNLPEGATFDPTTATFSWTPGYHQAGSYTDVEFSVTDDGNPIELDVELISITVGNINRAPVVTAGGPRDILQYEDLEFNVMAVDPDGDSIVQLYAGGLPVGASFDSTTRLFAWRPDGTQQGVYVVSFYATDNGTPALTGETGVVITVGEVESPTDLTDTIIGDVVADPDLPDEVENAYIANLKKVNRFIEDGKIIAAVNQLDAFIQKVQQDGNHGIIPQEEADLYILMAQDVINLLTE